MKNKQLLFFCIAFLFFSCAKKHEIKFDYSEPLSLTPGVEWALITEPYAAFRKDCNYESAVASHGRKGDILQVLGKKSVVTKTLNERGREVDQTTVWYYFENGWLEEASVELYDNRFKALSAAKES